MLDAAKAMKLSAKDLLKLEIIDEIVPEPIGGAHRDKDLILENIRSSIKKNLDSFKLMSAQEIFDQRKNKFLKIGRNKGFISNLEELSTINSKEKNFTQIIKSKKFLLILSGIAIISLLSFFTFL